MPHGLTVPFKDAAKAKSNRPSFGDPKTEHLRGRLEAVIIEDCKPLLNFYLKELSGVAGLRILNTHPITSLGGALALVHMYSPRLVLTDYSLTPAGNEGVDILRHIRHTVPSTIVVLTTSNYDAMGQDQFSLEVRSLGYDAIFRKLDAPGPRSESDAHHHKHAVPHIEHLKAYLESLTRLVH